jgi:CheY-like chemotaxis protein
MLDVSLVEDDQLIHQMLLFRLEFHAYSVDSAYDGQEGYEKAKQKNYDVILLDMHMPVMDGHAAAKKLREENYKGLIIAVTASVMTEETNHALESGCNYFISKPIEDNFEELINTYFKVFSLINK